MRKNIQPWLMAFMTTILTYALGVLYQVKVGVSYTPIIYAGAFLIILIILNKKDSFERTHFSGKTTCEERVDAFEVQKQLVNTDYKQFVSSYESAVNDTRIWMAACFAVVGFFSFAVGVMGYASTISIFFALIPLYLFWGLFAWLIRIPSDEVDDKYILDKEEYKSLYKVLDKVFANEKKAPVLAYASSANFSVSRINGGMVIAIGPIVMSVLDENEFEQLLLFEKGYFTNRKKGACDKAAELIYHHGRLADYSKNIAFVEMLYLDKIINLANYSSYAERVAATYYEKLACEYVKENGDIRKFLSAIMKFRMLYLFQSYDRDLSVNVYEAENLRTDWYDYEMELFTRTFNEKKDFWKGLIRNELPYFSDTNLSFSEMLETVGSPDFDVQLSDAENSDSFTEDVKLYRRTCNEKVYNSAKDSYEEEHKNRWEIPKQIVDKYLKDSKEQKEYSSAELREVLEACYTTNEIELLQKLCRENIEKYGNGSHAAAAHYLLGLTLLHSYQEAGITHIYIAINANDNYIEGGLDEIERFCSIMNLKEELANCKNRRIYKMQKLEDTNAADICNLRAGDHISEETELPEEQQIENINAIKAICEDNIEELYQIHKIVSEELFTTAYVVKFKAEVSEEQASVYITKIFNYLDSLEWQYSLFNREDVYIADLPGRVI